MSGGPAEGPAARPHPGTTPGAFKGPPARAYQSELLELSKRYNIIVYLDTGGPRVNAIPCKRSSSWAAEHMPAALPHNRNVEETPNRFSNHTIALQVVARP